MPATACVPRACRGRGPTSPRSPEPALPPAMTAVRPHRRAAPNRNSHRRQNERTSTITTASQVSDSRRSPWGPHSSFTSVVTRQPPWRQGRAIRRRHRPAGTDAVRATARSSACSSSRAEEAQVGPEPETSRPALHTRRRRPASSPARGAARPRRAAGRRPRSTEGDRVARPAGRSSPSRTPVAPARPNLRVADRARRTHPVSTIHCRRTRNTQWKCPRPRTGVTLSPRPSPIAV